MKLSRNRCFLCGRIAGPDRTEDMLYRIEVHEIYNAANRKFCVENDIKVPLCRGIRGVGCHPEAHKNYYETKTKIMDKLGFSEEEQVKINQLMRGNRNQWDQEQAFFMTEVIKVMQEMWK